MRADAHRTIYLKDYTPPKYLVDKVEMTFQLYDDHVIVKTTTGYRQNHKGQEPLVLDAEYMEILSVKVNGKDATYESDEHNLTLPYVGESFSLETEVKIHPNENTRLEGLYTSESKFITQCESEGFRSITPFQDRPDVMTYFTVRIEADKKKYPVLLSNGNPHEEGDLEDGRHYAVWEDPSLKPCYLFALVAGDLKYIEDHFKTMSGRDVTLRIYVKDGDQSQCYHAMESLKHAMKWDEDKYGREYDLDRYNIVAVSDYNFGAMENKSLNIFNTAALLADAELTSDAGFEQVERVIGHEYFHNWSGNRVTCRDWFQISLKEGLTVFRDQTFSADMGSANVVRIDDVNDVRHSQFTEDAGPMAHPVRPDHYIEVGNFYTRTVYDKGAEVIRMFSTILGPEKYREATDLYFDRHDGQAVTTDDFAKCMEDVYGEDLSQFKLWYSQAGTPKVTAKSAYDEAAKTFTLTLTQEIPDTPGQTNKKPMHIPVSVGLVGPNGADMDLGEGETTKVLHLKEPEQSFTFENVPSKPVPSILRQFSAPVKLETDLTEEDLRFLMVHDSDGFNKWEAANTIKMRMLNRMIDEGSTEPDESFMKSFGELLDEAGKPGADQALAARELALPGITIIGQSRDVIDPGAIYKSRRGVSEAIAVRYREKIAALYDALQAKEDGKIDGIGMGRRALKNYLLGLLCLHPDNPALDKAKAQYDNATCMTDRAGALMCVTDHDDPIRDAMFKDYYDRYKDHALVIDKWFAFQAMAKRDNIIKDLRALTKHPDFNIKNPNRARALYGAFLVNNLVVFHDPNGEGYDFVTDAVLELDKINPMVATRLLSPITDWKRFTPDRQEKMKACLKRVQAEKKLSPDVFELVQKSLDD